MGKRKRSYTNAAKIKMTELRRQVADLVEAAKIRWIEKKVEKMENKHDPRGAWRAMREISTMFAGHIKSAVTMSMPKKDGTTATTDDRTEAVIAEPFAADDIETAVNKLSPRSNQSTERATVCPP